jgi:hypothetical protein
MKDYEVINELTEAILAKIQERREDGESDLRQIRHDVESMRDDALAQLRTTSGCFTVSSLLGSDNERKER